MKWLVITWLIFLAATNLAFILVNILVNTFSPVLLINCAAVIVSAFAAGVVAMT